MRKLLGFFGVLALSVLSNAGNAASQYYIGNWRIVHDGTICSMDRDTKSDNSLFIYLKSPTEGYFGIVNKSWTSIQDYMRYPDIKFVINDKSYNNIMGYHTDMGKGVLTPIPVVTINFLNSAFIVLIKNGNQLAAFNLQTSGALSALQALFDCAGKPEDPFAK